jgi:hypothetical protein
MKSTVFKVCCQIATSQILYQTSFEVLHPSSAPQTSHSLLHIKKFQPSPLHISGMAQPRSECKASVHLFPRRKAGSKDASLPAKGRAPILVSYQAIAPFFGQPQNDAARQLGISLTTLKQVCRKLGLTRWPYMRPCKSASSKRMREAARAAKHAQAKAARTAKAEHSENWGRCASDDSHCSAETICAGESRDENVDGRVMQTSDRHLDEVFSPSEASDNSSDIDKALDDTMDIVAIAIDEPENVENEHDHEFDASDLGWLVMPDYQETTLHKETAWWATVQETYNRLRVASELHTHNRFPTDTLGLRSALV